MALHDLTDAVAEEHAWRLTIWRNLQSRADTAGLVTPDAVRSVGAFGAYQSIWVDAKRTKPLAPTGVTIGLKHTGRRFAEDLSDDHVLYHYPATREWKKRIEGPSIT
ncbi:hypothetical protein ACF1DY_03390 [Streptomyces albus]